MNYKQQLQTCLIKAMQDKGHSYAKVAEIVGTSRQAIHQTLTSEKVTLDKLLEFATEYGIEIKLNFEVIF